MVEFSIKPCVTCTNLATYADLSLQVGFVEATTNYSNYDNSLMYHLNTDLSLNFNQDLQKLRQFFIKPIQINNDQGKISNSTLSVYGSALDYIYADDQYRDSSNTANPFFQFDFYASNIITVVQKEYFYYLPEALAEITGLHTFMIICFGCIFAYDRRQGQLYVINHIKHKFSVMSQKIGLCKYWKFGCMKYECCNKRQTKETKLDKVKYENGEKMYSNKLNVLDIIDRSIQLQIIKDSVLKPYHQSLTPYLITKNNKNEKKEDLENSNRKNLESVDNDDIDLERLAIQKLLNIGQTSSDPLENKINQYQLQTIDPEKLKKNTTDNPNLTGNVRGSKRDTLIKGTIINVQPDEGKYQDPIMGQAVHLDRLKKGKFPYIKFLDVFTIEPSLKNTHIDGLTPKRMSDFGTNKFNAPQYSGSFNSKQSMANSEYPQENMQANFDTIKTLNMEQSLRDGSNKNLGYTDQDSIMPPGNILNKNLQLSEFS